MPRPISLVQQISELSSSLHQLSDLTIANLVNEMSSLSLKKKESLFLEGDPCKHLYFIEQGAVKSYHLHEGYPYCNWIYFENEFFTSWYSFLTGKHAIESFEACEDTIIYQLGIASLEKLKLNHPDLNLFLVAYYQSFIGMSDFLYKKHNELSAKQKYEFFQEHYPKLIARGKGKDVASILGVTSETYSRIRAQIAKGQ